MNGTHMKKTLILAAAIAAISTAAFSADHAAVANAVASCCDVIAECCKQVMACCPIFYDQFFGHCQLPEKRHGPSSRNSNAHIQCKL
jgi:hypothetical protein